MEIKHLDCFVTYKHGPIQQDEALFLYSVVKMTRPRVILEFGIQDGLSTLNFAVAKDRECQLFSFDNDPEAVRKGREKVKEIPNCFLETKDCRDFLPGDVFDQLVDICFLDCAHDLEINKQCVRRFMPCMNETGLVAIHDTGAWSKASYDAAPEEYKQSAQGRWLAERFVGREFWPAVLAERRTANWFLQEYPEYAQVHFHSSTYFRHGITLLQKKSKLEE